MVSCNGFGCSKILLLMLLNEFFVLFWFFCLLVFLMKSVHRQYSSMI